MFSLKKVSDHFEYLLRNLITFPMVTIVTVTCKPSRKFHDRNKPKSLQETMEVLNKLIVVAELITVCIKEGHYDCVLKLSCFFFRHTSVDEIIFIAMSLIYILTEV
jgi:hypothetical protein